MIKLFKRKKKIYKNKPLGFIAILTLLGSLFFTSLNITGYAIGMHVPTESANTLGAFLFITGIFFAKEFLREN